MLAALLVVGVLDFGNLFHVSGSVNATLTLLAGLVFVVAHGSAAFGWRNIAAFIAITVVISFTSEVVGVATGLVFGPYHYTDLLGPKLLGVPPLIQLGYLAVGYASMVIGRIILSLLGPVKHWAILAAALAGTFIMVSWDVAMDPYQSTVSGDWIWHTGGPYFGVPLHNYAGWFGTVFAFMLVYFIYASRYTEQSQPEATKNPAAFWSLAVVLYALFALGIVVTPLVGIALPYASPANYNDAPQVLGPSLSLIAIFVMGSPVVFALCRLLTKGAPIGRLSHEA